MRCIVLCEKLLHGTVMHRNTAHGSGIQPIQLSTGSVKKQSPLHFIVMSTYVDRFLQYLALVY